MRRRIKELCDQGRLREALECVSRIEPRSGLCKKDGLKLVVDRVLGLPNKQNEERNTLLAEIVAMFLWLGDIEEATRCLLKIDNPLIVERFSEIIERTIRVYQDEQLVVNA